MKLTQLLWKTSANKAPIRRIDIFENFQKDTTVQVNGFEDPIARRIFTLSPPKRPRLKWPELPPQLQSFAQPPSSALTPNEPWHHRILREHPQMIHDYLRNNTKGYVKDMFTLDEQQIHMWLFKTRKLKKDLHPNQYKTVVFLYKNTLPFPDYLFEEDRRIIPLHSAVRHLTIPLRKSGGRNKSGMITVRHRGGGYKRRIRLVNYVKSFTNPITFIRYEYDPNRSARIALVQDNVTCELSYVLMSAAIEPGTVIDNSSNIPSSGMTLALRDIPGGTKIFNIEIHPGNGGQLVRSAGTCASLLGKDLTKNLAQVKLPSGKVKEISLNCTATIGSSSNPEWASIPWGKAGRVRNRGIRPTVRGVAMNANEHPHGGGKGGKSKGHHSQSPWGKICK